MVFPTNMIQSKRREGATEKQWKICDNQAKVKVEHYV